MIRHVEYRWNDDNVDHLAKHGVSPWEAEQVIDRSRRPYPKYIGDGKWIVWGQTAFGEYLQVICIEDPPPQQTT